MPKAVESLSATGNKKGKVVREKYPLTIILFQTTINPTAFLLN